LYLGPVPITYLPGPLHLLFSLSLSPAPRHCTRPSPCLCVGALGWFRRSPRGTDLREKVLFSCARCLRAPRSCLKLVDLLLCCCVHPCEFMRVSSLAEEYKSVIGERKLKVILQAVFEKKIRPPALQQCLVHSLLDRTLGATKQ
jgi:hypothetical protein